MLWCLGHSTAPAFHINLAHIQVIWVLRMLHFASVETYKSVHWTILHTTLNYDSSGVWASLVVITYFIVLNSNLQKELLFLLADIWLISENIKMSTDHFWGF